MADDVNTTTTEGQGTQSANPPNAQTADNGTATNAGQGERTYSNEEVQRIVSERLDREKKASEAKAAKDKEAADAQRLKEQAEWEKLANQHEAKVKELEPTVEALTAERDTLAKHLADLVATETRDWPKEVKDLLPAEDSGVLARYEAVTRTRPLAERLGGADTRQRGNGPGPRPNGAAGQQTSETIIDQKRASGMYSPF